MRRSTRSLVVGLSLIAWVHPTAAAAPDRYPKAAAAYLVAVDGRVLWERAADTPRAPASLAKIMTALVALDGDWNPDAIITVSRRAAAVSGSRLGLAAGNRIRAGDALTAMLVRSCNDAALAIAEHAGGNVAAFVERMNARARSLGLTATHFANPTGLDDPQTTSSARDLLRLTEVALEQPEFARRTSMMNATVTVDARRVNLSSSNALIGRLSGAVGVKTGFTNKAGTCVIVCVDRGPHRVLVVLLNSADRWWTAAALVEAAFDATRAPAGP